MMKKYLLAAAAVLAASAGVANASVLSVTNATVTVWNKATPGDTSASAEQQASNTNPLAVSANQIYSGTYTGPINFFVASGTPSVGTFLGTAGGTFSGPVSGLSEPLSSSNFSQTTVMEIVFNTVNTISAGTINHDDGVALYADGTSTDLLAPSAASPVYEGIDSSPVLTAGKYDLFYVEANGTPAQLTYTATVPEPASLALLGAGLAGVGMVRRRRSRKTA